MSENIRSVTAAIDYIENHLDEKPDLDTVSKAVHYSKYHLHRMFTETAGLTVRTYAQRRRLTEAAKLLVFSDRPILEIALAAGYESQQSFTDSFRAMYKKPPHRYREEKTFYPLQLRFVLNETPAAPEEENGWRRKIARAADADIPDWMELVRLVIDGFPCLDEGQHLRRLREFIRNGRAWMLKDADTAVGIMAFHERTGSLDFLGVHPQYRNKGIEKAFCEKALQELVHSREITVTTFREGDKADTGYRQTVKSLGFAEAELLVEFGYPTQRFVLSKAHGRRGSQESAGGSPGPVLQKEEKGEVLV